MNDHAIMRFDYGFAQRFAIRRKQVAVEVILALLGDIEVYAVVDELAIAQTEIVRRDEIVQLRDLHSCTVTLETIPLELILIGILALQGDLQSNFIVKEAVSPICADKTVRRIDRYVEIGESAAAYVAGSCVGRTDGASPLARLPGSKQDHFKLHALR